MSDAKMALTKAIDQLYEVFDAYERPAKISPCLFCWTEEELDYFRATPVRLLESHRMLQLIDETGDHWQSSETYKYYLPRILEVLAPPTDIEDLYPEHLFQVLNYHHFRKWPPHEKEAILAYISAVASAISTASPADAQEWIKAAETLER